MHLSEMQTKAAWQINLRQLTVPASNALQQQLVEFSSLQIAISQSGNNCEAATSPIQRHRFEGEN